MPDAPSRESTSPGRLPPGAALAWARRDTARARARLERVYGSVPPVVFAFSREAGGPVELSCGVRLVGRVARLYRDDPRPVTVCAVVPGGRALLEWLKGNVEFGHGVEHAVYEARAFGTLHAFGFQAYGDLVKAGTFAVAAMDSHIADVERLYARGVSVTAMAELAGVERAVMRRTVERMRALGFDMPHRNTYARRTSVPPRTPLDS